MVPSLPTPHALSLARRSLSTRLANRVLTGTFYAPDRVLYMGLGDFFLILTRGWA